MVEQRINSEVQTKELYVKPMKDPLDGSPSKGNQGTTRGKEKILLTSVGIEPTTSGKVRVHMNVVPRSTMSTNGFHGFHMAL